MTTRRRLLRTGLVTVAGGIALAGCLARGDAPFVADGGDGGGDGSSDRPGNDAGSDGGGTRPEGTSGPSLSIVATDPAPALPVVPSVRVTTEAATEASPPELTVTLTNGTDRPVRVGEGRAAFFEYVGDDAGDLLLLPVGEAFDWPAAAGCWRLTDGIAVTEEYRTVEIPAGERLSRRVGVYAIPAPDDEGDDGHDATGGDTDSASTSVPSCLPVGEFRFETRIATDALSEDDTAARWGFSVLLE